MGLPALGWFLNVPSDLGLTLSPVILITCASSGISAATACLFSQRGYRVVLAARREDRLVNLVEEIKRLGGQALAVPTDIGQRDQIETLVTRTLDAYRQIDVLFTRQIRRA